MPFKLNQDRRQHIPRGWALFQAIYYDTGMPGLVIRSSTKQLILVSAHGTPFTNAGP